MFTVRLSLPTTAGLDARHSRDEAKSNKQFVVYIKGIAHLKIRICYFFHPLFENFITMVVLFRVLRFSVNNDKNIKHGSYDPFYDPFEA